MMRLLLLSPVAIGLPLVLTIPLAYFVLQSQGLEEVDAGRLQQEQFIDVTWKFNQILLLPVGCSWARSAIWRINLQCPPGSFVVPTRLQVSSNRTKFCGVADHPPVDLYDIGTFSLQKKNPYNDPKLARRYSREMFADRNVNSYDNPYLPLYNASSQLWNCVGSSSCVFTINASDYREMEVSHGSERKNNMSQLIMTIVLPGPYCSTVDMFDHYDRYGGLVYKMSRYDFPIGSFYQLETRKFSPSIQPNTTSSLRRQRLDNATLVALSRNPRLKQSEDVYLVIGHEKAVNPLNHCLLTIIPRDSELARMLYRRDKNKFMNSLQANFHVHFLQVTYKGSNGYSTFYDDMPAIQHDHLWANMFSIVKFDNTTASIRLAVNFDLNRKVDKHKIRVGLALFEVLVVGDENAALLRSSWPYRYASPSREMSSRILLFRNVTVNECTHLSQTELVVSLTDTPSLVPVAAVGAVSTMAPRRIRQQQSTTSQRTFWPIFFPTFINKNSMSRTTPGVIRFRNLS